MRTKSAIDCFYTCKHFHRLHSLFPLFPFRAPCSPLFVLSLFKRSGSASYFQPVNDVAYRWRWLLCVYNQMHCYASARVLSLSRIAFLFFPLVFVFFGFCSFCLGVSFFLVKLEADGAVPRRFPLTSSGMPRFNLEINASNAAPKWYSGGVLN